jgi:acyl CoA:acetate/3-ketoacid CoA transferase
MNKIVSSPEQAVVDIADGATVAIAGFGVAHRFATSLICALRDQRTKELTLVCNSLGDAGATRGQILAENNQVKKYPLTGKGCVSYVVTDLALLRWDRNRFVLEEVAPGYTPPEVLALTEMDVAVAVDVRTMQ